MKLTKRLLPHAIAVACIGALSSYASVANAAVCEHVVQNEWNSGFVAEVQITNDGDSAINGWEVTWSYDNAVVSSTWNGAVTGSNPYTASNLAWNGAIAPGQTVVFGVQGSKNVVNGPTPVATVTGDICGDAVVIGDDDNDGVNNDIDQCADTPAGDEVDEVGCTIPVVIGDDDNDGVNNDIDQCLDTPAGDEVDEVGCTIPVVIGDDDNDGVNNDIDQCLDTPAGDEVDEVGCTIPVVIGDDDNDGVNNDIDQCLDTPAGDEVDEVGCTIPVVIGDDDNDGVNNDIDQCLDTPAGDEVDEVGCTIPVVIGDDDNDGVTNDMDQCPDTAAGAIVDETGCEINSELGKGAGHDNPWEDAVYYVDPLWSAKAAAEPGGEAIAGYNTAVWMDRIGAIAGPTDGDGMGLRAHMDAAVEQGADLIMAVVYDLPNRDCAALASNGELRISEGGFETYQTEYIGAYASILADPAYKDLRIVLVIEVDSLPNLITNLDYPDCVEADGPGGYRDGITYALNVFSQIPNVYSYVDIAHSGWLGWTDNFAAASEMIAQVVKDTDKGWDSVAGFVSNSSNYTPVEEPYLPDPTLSINGSMPIRSTDFYEWNSYFDEKSFVQDWREAMISFGAPESLGMLIDTARNGWGGPDRPTATSKSDDIETYVNESRIDRREHRGNWCNQPGGVGYKPFANPYEGVDAFVWVKPQGESDGISDPDFEIDPNDPAKQHDPMCDPNAPNRDNNAVGTGALDNAPHAGRWFPEAFAVLLENAYPAAELPPGGPISVPLPTDCEGFDPAAPLVLAAGQDGLVDFRCGDVYVEFTQTTQNIEFDNTGSAMGATIEYNGTSEVVDGYYQGLKISTDSMKLIKNEGGASSLAISFY